ncbi:MULTISPECIES: hypothetical protein [Sphingobium]|jgi:hypothetical protein|uniref:hypothetical protein n=1 Tax=Sphingobium TaxID=165695 RepID=UPI001D17E74C|nr:MULTISPECIES: hypothetical protein [Sphingobium]MCC4255940.1 hypothetical protein [Sphingobium lactosutens]MEE2740232.1 hypothetical protein [Pseudomonadota bacterium]
MWKQTIIAAYLGATVTIPSSAQACSVVRGYRVPTTLQLVEGSDAIVLAKVRAGAVNSQFGFRQASLTPIALLKGDQLPQQISYEYGAISSRRWKAVASNPRNLQEPNPDVFSGGCNRQVFDKGMLVVTFLKKEGNTYVVNAPPFSRALEDVPSSDALWVKAIKIYVKIAALPGVKRRKAMEAERARLAARKNDPDAPLLARELDRALHENP